jgi:ABC-type lipoprotein export system ATPase subunit
MFRGILHDVKAEDSHLDSKGKFVLIVGDTGIGKTRMLEEFMDVAENEEFR